MGRELICLWVGDVEICQELMTFMILFGFLPHSLVFITKFQSNIYTYIYTYKLFLVIKSIHYITRSLVSVLIDS